MQRIIKSMEAKYLQPSLELVENVFAQWDSAEEGKTVRRLVEEIIQSIEHFYGHLEIVPSGYLGLCSVESKTDVSARVPEIIDFCSTIF